MIKAALSTLATALLLLTAAIAGPPAASKKPTAQSGDAGAAFYRTQVRPILSAACWTCHSGDSPSGGLDLTSRAALLKGGSSGPSIDLKKPPASLLVRAVHFDGRQMPPSGRLPQSQIDILSRWAAMGAPWDDAAASPVVSGTGPLYVAPAHHGPPPVNAENMRFWSFQTVKRPTVPAVKNVGWVRGPIDAFILAKLEKNGFTPAPPASRETLIRRAYFDVIGLPPTPEEVRAFVADRSLNAYEKVVDRLLASPQYGERWGRHWLDLVRYAETNSFERDGDKPFVWRYRDYVIRSFNDDKPYDRFIREQLAGDELPAGERSTDSLIATGYYRLCQWDDEPVDQDQARADELDDILSTTGQTFLGLTVGCARCHDHKIDPIPQKDYYSLTAFFQNIRLYGARNVYSPETASLRPISSPAEQARYAKEDAAFRKEMVDLNARIFKIDSLVRGSLAGGEVDDFVHEGNRASILKKRIGGLISQTDYDEYVRLTAVREDLRRHQPKGLEMALCVTEPGPMCTEASHVLMRGNAHAIGDEVKPGFLSVLSPPAPDIQVPPADASSCERRTALADWIASPKNPLTARVMANRLWQFHFGRGIVRTASNFGFQGSPPTHPELLDYLASELVKNGWHLKPLHRMILLSNAYRMSSRANPKALAKDPENDFFWRFDMRRLDAEEVRDSLLAANGSLNPRMFGPSILVTLPREVLLGQSIPGLGWGESTPEEQARRSVYIKVKRSLAVPILARFDSADVDNTCPVRFATTQPTQALGMLNSAFVNQQAKVMADFAVKSVPKPDTAARVRFILWRVLQREPTAAEVKRGVDLIAALQKQNGRSPDAALTDFCLVALNLDEFLFLD